MNQLSPSEQRILWDSVRHGDRNAFSQLYDLFAADLYRYGFTLIQNKSIVEDCLHELFLHLHKNRQRLGPTDNIRLYLFQGLRQQLLDAETRFKRDDSKTSFSSKPKHLITPRSTVERRVISRVIKHVYHSIILALTRLQTGKRSSTPQHIARI